MARNILHVDMNCFYAAVEVQRRPELRGKPVAVCGSQEERHGIVLTANYVAKPMGAKTGMAIWQAKQCCPDVVVLLPDMREYIRISKLARETYEDYTDQWAFQKFFVKGFAKSATFLLAHLYIGQNGKRAGQK